MILIDIFYWVMNNAGKRFFKIFFARFKIRGNFFVGFRLKKANVHTGAKIIFLSINSRFSICFWRENLNNSLVLLHRISHFFFILSWQFLAN